jgi:penicillin G amidase
MSDQAPARIDYQLPGLEQAAEIRVDPWGIPHIRAGSRRDAFFVQGFNAGRDRLWQLDMWRKRGLGQLAADFGPGFLAQDRAARLFLYRRDMREEWAAYGDCGAQATAEAFVAGLNAWIDLTEGDPSLLTPEFTRFGSKPAKWQASDVVRIRTHARSNNLLSEELRARVIGAGGTSQDDLLRKSVLPDHQTIVPQGIDYAALPASVLDVYRLATAPLCMTPERLSATLDQAWRWSKANDLGEVQNVPDGSNAWVVSGARTASGRPILANDPHRVHTLPSLRYVVHLTAPGLDVIGGGEPALPGVSIGHNGSSAFGLTIFPMDQEDLYVYETAPGNPDRYRYDGGWEDMTVETQSISVRGHGPQDVTLKFTRHGPVVFEDTAGRRAYAVRTVWSEPGTSAYFASLGYLGARTPSAFGAALRHWGAPPVNHVYADESGNIAWFVAGKSPRRANWDGLLPVPGDGRYEWQGFVRADDMPRRVNPASGFFATANEYNVPADDPAFDRELGFETPERSRAVRINEVLQGQSRHAVEDAAALQCDVTSVPARRLVPLLHSIAPDSGELRAGLSLLNAWNFEMRAASGAAALFEVWWNRHLKPAVLDCLLSRATVREQMKAGDNEALLAVLEQAGTETGYLSARSREALLATTLTDAFSACRSLMGDECGNWQWGRLHQHTFAHPLGDIGAGRNVGPFPLGGSESTPCYANYRPDNFRVIAGASMRLVLDVGDWDNSRVVNAPGQSGNSQSLHYGDHADPWCKGESVPLLFSSAAVDAATELIIHLTPGRAQTPNP